MCSVQSANNDTTEKNINIRNIVSPGLPCRPLGPCNFYLFTTPPSAPDRHWYLIEKLMLGTKKSVTQRSLPYMKWKVARGVKCLATGYWQALPALRHCVLPSTAWFYKIKTYLWKKKTYIFRTIWLLLSETVLKRLVLPTSGPNSCYMKICSHLGKTLVWNTNTNIANLMLQ